MKNRVYKIKDKILVRGNENELTKDEILVKEENDSVVLKERVNGEVKDIVVKGGEITPINIGNYSEVTDSSKPNAFLYSSITEEIYTYISDAQAIEFTIDYSGTQLKITSYFCSKTEDTYSFYGIAEANGIKIPTCVFINSTRMYVTIPA